MVALFQSLSSQRHPNFKYLVDLVFSWKWLIPSVMRKHGPDTARNRDLRPGGAVHCWAARGNNVAGLFRWAGKVLR